ncbi:hypothetical protein RMCBS344292_06661 [Rhizopus microsporus]|nr:hypothetical protein RMCBS344292_06661 [Rhizopus microsporus]
MKVYSLLIVTALLLETCSAGIWGSSEVHQVDPQQAERDLPDTPTSKYDYKLSFKKPYYYNNSVPFWSTGGGKENDASALANTFRCASGGGLYSTFTFYPKYKRMDLV